MGFFRGPRRGFSILEVLVALFILVIGFAGVAALAAAITRKAKLPNVVDQATYFAVERLNYFRGQIDQPTPLPGVVNGYIAAGGTYYPPPPPNSIDDNANAAYHNVAANKVPTLLVREFLYDSTESHDTDQLTGEAVNQRARKRLYIRGTRIIRNEIPATPYTVTIGANQLPVARVVANNEAGPTLAPNDQGNSTAVIPAARANDHLRGNGFEMRDRSMRFVREVWTQAMHPGFPPGALLPGAPIFRAAPPYCVAITIRVYLKEAKVITYAAVANPALPNSGPGYRAGAAPIAEMVGFFGLP